jgi:hypothetical protein
VSASYSLRPLSVLLMLLSAMKQFSSPVSSFCHLAPSFLSFGVGFDLCHVFLKKKWNNSI